MPTITIDYSISDLDITSLESLITRGFEQHDLQIDKLIVSPEQLKEYFTVNGVPEHLHRGIVIEVFDGQHSQTL